MGHECSGTALSVGHPGPIHNHCSYVHKTEENRFEAEK